MTKDPWIPTNTVGGGIYQTAVIGHAPEHRDWRPGDPACRPEVDPSSRIHSFVTIDAGLKRGTHVGARTLLMCHVHVGHDAFVAHDVEIAPNTTICGHAVIGPHARIGANSVVLPGVEIGHHAIVGAGSVVTRDVPPHQVWAGNPARLLRHTPVARAA